MANPQPLNSSNKQEIKDKLKLKSDEEVYFYWYLVELLEKKIILNFESAPKSITLSLPVKFEKTVQGKRVQKTLSKKLLNEHIYTPDFEILWNAALCSKFAANTKTVLFNKDIPFLKSEPVNYSCIEVKPAFDHQGMQRLFTINQKWVYEKTGIYVQKIIPQELFDKTFTPKNVISDPDLIYKKGALEGMSKIKWNVRSLEDFLK